MLIFPDDLYALVFKDKETQKVYLSIFLLTLKDLYNRIDSYNIKSERGSVCANVPILDASIFNVDF